MGYKYGVKQTRKSRRDYARRAARALDERVGDVDARPTERRRGMSLGDGNRWVSFKETEEAPEWTDDDRVRDLVEIFGE